MPNDLRGTVLMVDDEPALLDALKEALEIEGFCVHIANNLSAAKSVIEQSKAIETIICDLSLPNENGLELLDYLKEKGSVIPFIILTGQGTVETCRDALKSGAYDYIMKPIDDSKELIRLISQSIEKFRLKKKNIELEYYKQGMSLAKDFMSKDLISVNIDATAADAVAKMSERKISSILIMEGENAVGIFTERDAMNRVLSKGSSLNLHEIPIKDVMTKTLVFADVSQPWPELVTMMKEKKIRHVPVTDKGKVVGILSLTNMLDHYHQVLEIKTVKEMINTFHHYMNQPLMASYSYIHILLMKIPETDQNYPRILKIKQEIDRVNETLKKILALGDTVGNLKTTDYVGNANMIDLG
ncbi:MAG: response regulator [Candidatus Omnitrophica bacterium]|nr:response regulator [Candidatus Omnitrophota bacterium]